MKLNLYDYQKIAVSQMKNGCILCGGVGSGKSLTSLAYYYTHECDGKIKDDGTLIKIKNKKPLYIITTARKRDTKVWEEELEKFGITATAIDSWNSIKKYCNVCSSFFIFDEQRVVGSGAWVKAFFQITKKNNWVLLSATPGDKWVDYIPVFIANGFYKNRTEFKRRHIVMSPYTRFPKIERYLEETRLKRLREMILVDMDYVKHTVPHELTVKADYDREIYRTIMRQRWNPFKDRPIKGISELCYLLRYVCNSDESRTDIIKSILSDHPKIVVFYNFDYELDILRNVGVETNVTVAEWNGHKHMSIPKDGSWMYLVQYTAGAEGWNCTDTNAMVFYSQSYSYKATVQAAGRIDRTNSPYTDLYYYYIRSNSPIDIAIARTLKSKKAFNERSYFKDLRF
jgi:hypothetical protein